MNRFIFTILFAASQLLALTAQVKAPKWMSKGRNAVVTITTYDSANKKVQSGTGFFISETGEALSAYSLFKGIAKAEISDAEGNTYPVDRVLGGDELYDVIRFQVAVPKKVAFFSIAKDPVPMEATIYLLPYSNEKTPKFKQGKIIEITKLKDSYNYYKVSVPLEATEKNAPILTEEGQVVGLAQEDVSKAKGISYALSAGYGQSLQISSTDVLSTKYSSILIKKAWPNDINQALVALLLQRGSQGTQAYKETINDFIHSFPSAADGYLNRASFYAHNRKELAGNGNADEYLKLALADLETAAKYTENKGDVFYNRAKLILEITAEDTTLTAPDWSLSTASEMIQKAIEKEDLPIYHQIEGDIYFYQKQYENAFLAYEHVNSSSLATPQSFYMAAKAKENITGFNIGDVIALLDSAITKSGNPPAISAAPYILERIDWKTKMMLYKEAVEDYDLYYKVVRGTVETPFFYLREQAKFKAEDFKGALADIQEAIARDSLAPDYQAEAAAIYIRMEDYAKAEAHLDKALKIAPEFASCYRLKGICSIRQNKKEEACTLFNKAKELGDPLADRLIKTHCK